MDIVERMRRHVASYKYLSPHRDNCLKLCDEIERLRAGINAVQSLIAESRGVEGLHLNGDIAEWGDLLAGGKYEEWLTDFSAALEGE